MKTTSRLIRFLRSLDTFGQPISFYIKGNTTYTTWFGGIITAFILILIMVISINSFINLINKANMTSTKDTVYALNPPYLNLTQQNFMFSIGVGDTNMKLNYSVFSFTASLVTVNMTIKQRTYTPITLRPCRYEDYNNTANDVAQTYIKNCVCPDNYSYGIYDFYPNPIYQYLYITVDRCVNGSNPYITCASEDYINAYIKSAGIVPMGFFFMNRVLDLQNIKNPIQTFTDLQFWLINLSDSLRPSTNLYLRSSQLTSYDDIFGISSPNIYNFITYEKERIDNIVSLSNNPTTFAELSVYSSNYKNNYTRSYDDFLSVLSYIGGISNLLTMFAGFIVGIYNGYKYKMKMFNELWDFDLKEKIHKNNYEINRPRLNINNLFSKKIHMNPPDNSIINQKFEKIKNLRSRLTFSIADFCQYIFCSCKSKLAIIKIMLFNLADNQLSKDMDIIWLIKRIRDIDKLKTILLYPDKLKIFEFIPPPLISTDNHKKDQHGIIKSVMKNPIIKEETNEVLTLFDSGGINPNLNEYLKYRDMYINLKNSEDDISRNIISCLDPEIVQIFECIEDTKNYKQNLEVKEINSPGYWTTDDIFKQTNLLTKKDNDNKGIFMIQQDSCRKLQNGLYEIQERVMHESIHNEFQELANFSSFDMPIEKS